MNVLEEVFFYISRAKSEKQEMAIFEGFFRFFTIFSSKKIGANTKD